jgi:hypothetical protein
MVAPHPDPVGSQISCRLDLHPDPKFTAKPDPLKYFFNPKHYVCMQPFDMEI